MQNYAGSDGVRSQKAKTIFSTTRDRILRTTSFSLKAVLSFLSLLCGSLAQHCVSLIDFACDKSRHFPQFSIFTFFIHLSEKKFLAIAPAIEFLSPNGQKYAVTK